MTQSEPLEYRPTALYRFFDKDGALLYVGVTCDLKTRENNHGWGKAWWSQVASRTVEWFPRRSLAMEAEDVAIEEERPRYNVVGASRLDGVLLQVHPHREKKISVRPPEKVKLAAQQALDGTGWTMSDLLVAAMHAVSEDRRRVLDLLTPYRVEVKRGRPPKAAA